MGKKNFQIILTIVIFCACVFALWGLLQRQDVNDKLFDFLASNKSYAKSIQVEKYFLSEERVAKLFNQMYDTEKISHQQKSHDQSLYFVIRLRNNGGRRAWGTIRCKTSEFKEFDVPITSIVSDIYKNYVIPTCYTTSNPPPSLPTIKWKELYTNK